jgi:hypothetical protein
MSFALHFQSILEGKQDTSLIREYLIADSYNPRRGRRPIVAKTRSDVEVVVTAFSKIYEIDDDFKMCIDSQFPNEDLDAKSKIFFLYSKEARTCSFGNTRVFDPGQYVARCQRGCPCVNQRISAAHEARIAVQEAKNAQRNWICENKVDELSLADIVSSKETFTAYCRNKPIEKIMADLKISKPLLNYYIAKYELT